MTAPTTDPASTGAALDPARTGGPTPVLPPLGDIIDHLDATPVESWWAGPTFRSPCGTRHCVLAHIEARWGMAGLNEFEESYSTSYVIGAFVNDEPSAKYPQDNPRDRVVAFLRAMLAGDEMTTTESMERDYQASVKRDEMKG